MSSCPPRGALSIFLEGTPVISEGLRCSSIEREAAKRETPRPPFLRAYRAGYCGPSNLNGGGRPSATQPAPIGSLHLGTALMPSAAVRNAPVYAEGYGRVHHAHSQAAKDGQVNAGAPRPYPELSVSKCSPTMEAETCRSLAKQMRGAAEEIISLRLAHEFDRLACGTSGEDTPAHEMFTYYSSREAQELRAATQAAHPNARKAHLALAHRYGACAHSLVVRARSTGEARA